MVPTPIINSDRSFIRVPLLYIICNIFIKKYLNFRQALVFLNRSDFEPRFILKLAGSTIDVNLPENQRNTFRYLLMIDYFFSIHCDNYNDYILLTMLRKIITTTRTIPQSARYHDNSVAMTDDRSAV